MVNTNWHRGEPNNFFGSESVAVIWYTSSYGWQWADVNENNLYPFVCLL